MLKYTDVALPQMYFQKRNSTTPVGYNNLSCHFYWKGETIVIQQNSCESGGAYTVKKGIAPNGLPNKLTTAQEGDFREGVAANGNYQWEYYDGTDWVIVNILPSGGSNTTTDPDNYSCTLYKKAGTAFTDAGTMRICNVVGGLELYVRVSNTGDPNTDWAFQHLL